MALQFSRTSYSVEVQELRGPVAHQNHFPGISPRRSRQTYGLSFAISIVAARFSDPHSTGQFTRPLLSTGRRSVSRRPYTRANQERSRTMSRTILTASISILTFFATMFPVHAQRGVGDPVGIARQATRPAVTQVAGTLSEIRIGPCESTGHGGIGAHLILRTSESEYVNVHLGPAAAVEFVTKQLNVGQDITASVFRTEKLPSDHFVAVSVTSDSKTTALRDESLRPIWAGTGRGATGGGGRHQFRGGGRGRGYGRFWSSEQPVDSQS